MTTIGLVLDCTDPEKLAEFWSAALGYQRLGAAGSYVLLRSPEPALPKLLLQRVPEAKTVKNRMHLDIEAAEIEDEATRLQTLGARRARSGTQCEFGTTWILMEDPEGNEFCICDGGAGGV